MYMRTVLHNTPGNSHQNRFELSALHLTFHGNQVRENRNQRAIKVRKSSGNLTKQLSRRREMKEWMERLAGKKRAAQL
jgi:hypothetical protein